MAVHGPGKSAARFSHQKSEIFRVSDDIRPWGRRPLSFAKRADVFATAMCEAADAVEKRDLRRGQPGLGITGCALSRLKRRQRRFFDRSPGELILKRSSFADDHDPRYGMKQDALWLRNHV